MYVRRYNVCSFVVCKIFLCVFGSLAKMASTGSARIRLRRHKDRAGRWVYKLRGAEDLPPVELMSAERKEREVPRSRIRSRQSRTRSRRTRSSDYSNRSWRPRSEFRDRTRTTSRRYKSRSRSRSRSDRRRRTPDRRGSVRGSKRSHKRESRREARTDVCKSHDQLTRGLSQDRHARVVIDVERIMTRA